MKIEYKFVDGTVTEIEVDGSLAKFMQVPLRMHLFGFHERSLLTAKIIAHLIFMTIAFVIYAVFQAFTMDLPKPAFSSVICLMISLYLIGVILLVIAHSIANIFRKFGITFGITMFVYFVLMMLTGMMGISTEQLYAIFVILQFLLVIFFSHKI